jgi:hypothetical protein|tara:strand:+ start:109 stop:480 length:372 start_codon:yes stop_codon:yes gene_type:complete
MKLVFDTDIIYNFIAGGLLIAVSGYISKFYSSYVSGLLYGSLPLGAYYLYLYSIYNQGGKETSDSNFDKGLDFVNGSVIGGILWVIMLAVLYLNLHNPINMVFISSIVYVLIIFLQLRFIRST